MAGPLHPLQHLYKHLISNKTDHNLKTRGNKSVWITEKIHDEAAITVSARWGFEIGLSIRRGKGLNAGRDKVSGVGIRVTEVEDIWVVEVNGIGKR